MINFYKDYHMCEIEIRALVPVDTSGDGERDQIIIVGVVEDCTAVSVGIFNAPVPPGAPISAAGAVKQATILGAGVSAHGVSPTGNERVFTATFTLGDTTIFKGGCNEPPTSPIGFLAVCERDPASCRDDFLWDQLIDCEEGECPDISIDADVSDQCNVSLSIIVAPFVQGLSTEVDFGDGTSETVAIQEGPTVAGVALGQAAVTHSYDAPTATTFQVVVSISDQPECSEVIDIPVPACPPAPTPPCPVTQVQLALENPPPNFREGDCLPPGSYTIVATVVPAGATNTFIWSVDGIQAVVGERGVTAISGNRLTVQLSDSSLSVSVIAAGCASDGIDLHPCGGDCCPELEGLAAPCMVRCPPEAASTTATLTATGTDLDCAETFSWDFGDGATSETNEPTATHTYPRRDRFEASVTMVRPRQCGRPRTQRATTTVEPCPPPCYCNFLAIATAFLLLAFLSLMPIIACTADPGTKQFLLIVMLVVVVLLAIAWLWWLLDPCCKPTPCEHLRILFWVFSWALVVVGLLAIMQFCVSALPFGLFYVIIQQVLLGLINDQGCDPGAPSIFTWPFPACR